jgi:hypothetical protein
LSLNESADLRVSGILNSADKSRSPTNGIPACGFFVHEPEPFMIFD